MRLEQRAFAMRHLYVYPKLRFAYTNIPKNACTSFKRTFGRAQGWLGANAPSAHDMTGAHWVLGLTRYVSVDERLVVIRDPFDRILSGYLNKFLKREDFSADQAMETGLAGLLGPAASRSDTTFAHFVEYLSRTPGRNLNAHWRPQSDFIIGSYTRYLRFEHLVEDTAFLAQRGLVLDEARGHATSTIQRDLGPGWGDRRAGELRRVRQRRGVLPSRDNMYDERLYAKVAERYAEDVALFRSVQGQQETPGPQRLPTAAWSPLQSSPGGHGDRSRDRLSAHRAAEDAPP